MPRRSLSWIAIVEVKERIDNFGLRTRTTRERMTIQEAIKHWIKRERVNRMEDLIKLVQENFGCTREPAWRKITETIAFV